MANYVDDIHIINQLKELDNKVVEELSKDDADANKEYKLRFNQLMKGIYLTQNPFNFYYF